MKTVIECAFCDGVAQLHKQPLDLVFKKENFTAVQHFYKCDKCAEEFTTNEVDEITMLQVQNQYREKHSIPFPDEIAATRSKYGLPAAKMSEIIGLGPNGYSNYEKGEIPTTAIGNLLKAAANPDIFLVWLENNIAIFKPQTFDEVKARVEVLAKKENEKNPYVCNIDVLERPSVFNGFRTANIDKLANIVIAIIKECDYIFNDRLKINKLLFYIDFLHYKEFGFSISGISYRAIKYGPVPSNYDNIYGYLENESIITQTWVKENGGGAREIFQTTQDFEDTLFDSGELQTIRKVIDKFKSTPTWNIVDISHEERAWQELNPERQLISYQEYAFDLKGV